MALPPQHLHAPGCAAPLGGQCTCEPRPVSASGDNPAASFLVGGQRYEESLTGWEIDDNLLAVLANGGQTPVDQKPPDPTKRPKGQSKIARSPDEREDAIPIGLLIALVVIFGFVVLAARPQLASSPELAWVACLSILAMVVIGVVDRILRYLSR